MLNKKMGEENELDDMGKQKLEERVEEKKNFEKMMQDFQEFIKKTKK